MDEGKVDIWVNTKEDQKKIIKNFVDLKSLAQRAFNLDVKIIPKCFIYKEIIVWYDGSKIESQCAKKRKKR